MRTRGIRIIAKLVTLLAGSAIAALSLAIIFTVQLFGTNWAADTARLVFYAIAAVPILLVVGLILLNRRTERPYATAAFSALLLLLDFAGMVAVNGRLYA